LTKTSRKTLEVFVVKALFETDPQGIYSYTTVGMSIQRAELIAQGSRAGPYTD